jgi:hypothetical protein
VASTRVIRPRVADSVRDALTPWSPPRSEQAAGSGSGVTEAASTHRPRAASHRMHSVSPTGFRRCVTDLAWVHPSPESIDLATPDKEFSA